MMTLHVFGPAFGLPDPSPFVIKAEVLLKLSGKAYETRRADVRKAPKGKLPVLIDGDKAIADSTFIRFHLEDVYGIDFDASLSPAERGIAWSVEKMLEDHLYWAEVRNRWLVDANFDKGPRRFFDSVPAPVRPLVVAMIRRRIKRNLWGQGMGRHSDAEVHRLAVRGIDSLSGILGDKPFLMGPKACGVDATMFAFLSTLLCPIFDSRLREHALKLPNLIAYHERGMKLWYPGLAASNGANA